MPSLEILLAISGAIAVVAIVAFVIVRRHRSIEAEVAMARTGRAITSPLGGRLTKSRSALAASLRSVFGRSELDAEFWELFEEALIAADVGVTSSATIVERVRNAGPESAGDARVLLRSEVLALLAGKDRDLHLNSSPSVMMVVGVNGTGKTTSIAKIAKRLDDMGTTTLLAAADTFRAAADTQLRTWADRVGIEVVSGQQGADPASVAFDAYAAAKSRNKDVLIIDTAGRLHSKKNLMAELSKIRKVVERGSGQIDEVLMVLDATAGQNAIAQAREFGQAAGVTGIVLAKLDGTAKGGVVVAIEEDLGIPVKFIGIGEGLDDLIAFDPGEFVDALLGEM